MRHQDGLRPECTLHDVSISKERLPRLRLAIQACRLSFPAQVPAFSQQNRPDAQWRIVALYFVRGWSIQQLARRYGITQGRIRQVIRKWVERAVTLGYVQRIPPEGSIETGIEPGQFGTIDAPFRGYKPGTWSSDGGSSDGAHKKY